jgi:hypothetical protein
MTTLYEPEDPSLLNSPALTVFQACILRVAAKALQSGMSEASVDAVFKQHQPCLDIALDALTQAFGPLNTRSTPSMTIRSNESAATAFRRKSHKAMHRITDKYRPEAEATVYQEAASAAELQRSAENPPMTDGENSRVERLSRLNARRAAREGVNGYGGLDYDSYLAEDGRSDGSSTPVPGTFPFPTTFRTTAGAQHVGRPERRPQVSEENTFDRIPPLVPNNDHARDTTSVPETFPFSFSTAAEAQRNSHSDRRLQEFDDKTSDWLPAPVPDTEHGSTSAPGPFPLPLRAAAGAQHDELSDSQPQESDDNTSNWLPAPVPIAEHGSGSNAIRSDDNTSDCLPAPSPTAEGESGSNAIRSDDNTSNSLPPPVSNAEHGSGSNAMRSQGETAYLPGRPSTPDRPIVPQDFKEGGRGEPAPWSVNRAKIEENTEDWKEDLPESPKPSPTADHAIIPQETNASDHGDFVDRQAKKVEREEDIEDREAEAASRESRVYERLVPQDIMESDLSAWMMTSN